MCRVTIPVALQIKNNIQVLQRFGTIQFYFMAF